MNQKEKLWPFNRRMTEEITCPPDDIEEAWEAVSDTVHCIKEDLEWNDKQVAKLLRNYADTLD